MRALSQSFIDRKNALVNKPIRLLIIEDAGTGNLGDTPLRMAEYHTNVTYSGIVYAANNLTIDPVTENLSQEVDQLNVSIQSVDRIITSYLENNNALRGCKVTLRTVFADLLNDNSAYTDDIFYVASVQLTQSAASFTLKSKLDLFTVDVPNRRFYRETCQWIFKSVECGYAGAAATCDRTTATCDSYGNLIRYGGFPGTGQGIWRVYLG
jgi:lambda family phage minor tail protein L